MAAGTVALDAVLAVTVLALFYQPFRVKLGWMVEGYGLVVIFLLSALAVIGTLFLQYFDALQPCVLCWWQRVFMYPIPLISLIAIVKGQKLSDIADHIAALSFIGAGVALYQHLLQILPAGSLIPCSATDECAIRSIFEFGFVTLPWMSLTVFAVLFLVALVGRESRDA